jgi:hypothetical protein
MAGMPKAPTKRIKLVNRRQMPDDLLAGIVNSARPLLKRGVYPFEAEMFGAEMMGVITSLPFDRPGLRSLFESLIDGAGRLGSPEALVLLRVLALVGPDDLQADATRAAESLVAAGLTDCRWVAGLGTPEFQECFGHADGPGGQQGVAVVFRYGRRPHALVVLIDHNLGGGVKDVWPTVETDTLRKQYEYGPLEVAQYSPAEAHAMLSRALAAPPCPAEDDQAADVQDFLDLLRRRVDLLAPGCSPTPATASSTPTTSVMRGSTS